MKVKKIISFILLVLLFFNPSSFVFADEESLESIETSSSENNIENLSDTNENVLDKINTEDILDKNEELESEESEEGEENEELESEESEEGEENEELKESELIEDISSDFSDEDIEDIFSEEENIDDDFDDESFIMIDLIGLNLEDIYNIINIPIDNIIVNYEINENMEENIILEQSIIEGEVYDNDSYLELKVSTFPTEIEETQENKLDLLSNFSLSKASVSESNVGNSNILLNWDNVPFSYEYNWDNSSNCWYWGVWIDGICYKTPEGEYSTDVRHKMQLYCDNEYVYLHIIYSRDYGAKVNANDFQFFINGEMSAFQAEDSNRNTLANQSYPVGTHSLIISHRNNSMSYSEAEGSEGYLIVDNEENINNQLEIKIPLSELVRQNSNINLDNMSMVEFFSPNLMYRRISCAGSSTFGIIILIPIFILLFFKIFKYDKRKN